MLDLYASYVPDAEKAYRQGNKNAIYCQAIYPSSWEAPLLYTLDTIPISCGDLGRLSDWRTMQIAEDYYQFPVETCSMVKCTVGQWYKRKNDPKAVKRILGAGSQCEPYNMAWEIMKNEGYDIHDIDVSYRAYGVAGERLEKLVKFFTEQLYGAIEWLTGSKEIDEKRLRLEIQRKNRLLGKMRKILALRLEHPFYIRSLATALTLNQGLANYFGKPEEYEAALDLLIEEMENTPVDKEAKKRVIPLFWTGTTAQEFGVYEVIDQAGGALLGFRSSPNKLFREDVPPIEALARYVYDNQRAGAETYMRQFIDEEIDRIEVRGMILFGIIGCSYNSVEREMLRNYFQQKGLPTINLEGAFQIGAPSGQILTRVRAFIEMLS
ncbi:MAG: 2-hydroxyacyl-CoA dehydratase family protein [Syntrophomonadaceae bacterium]|nr:2-hydroxyacyl-CoA dehydratase family protein [Syntrophomonadaceae bacterium]